MFITEGDWSPQSYIAGLNKGKTIITDALNAKIIDPTPHIWDAHVIKAYQDLLTEIDLFEENFFNELP